MAGRNRNVTKQPARSSVQPATHSAGTTSNNIIPSDVVGFEEMNLWAMKPAEAKTK